MKTAASGQALRSGRHRSLPAAVARQRSPPAPAAVPEAEEEAAEHDARRDDGMLAEQGKPPPQPPAGQRTRRPARLAGNKRSRLAASAGNDEEEAITAEAAATAQADGEEEVREETDQAADRQPARLLRPKRRSGASVPAEAQPALAGTAIGGPDSDVEEEDGEAAGMEHEPPVPADLTRRPASRQAYPYRRPARRSSGGVARTAPPWRPAHPRRKYPAAHAQRPAPSVSPSADGDGEEEAVETDQDADSGDRAPRTAPDGYGPSHFPGEACIHRHRQRLCLVCLDIQWVLLPASTTHLV